MQPIEVSQSEIAAGKFILKYDCVKNEYTRPFVAENAQKAMPGLEACAEMEGGIFRKVEPDWRAFVTCEGKELGMIRWHINHPYAIRVKRAEARMSGWATFRSGQLGAELVCGKKKSTIPLANQPYLAAQKAERVWGLNREEAVETLSIEDVGNADHTTLCIQFSDLEPNLGLDHDLDDAQIFRTPLNAPNPANLLLEIEFEAGKKQQVEEEKQQKADGDVEEEIVSKQILHLQMAQESKKPVAPAAVQNKPQTDFGGDDANGPLNVSDIELNGLHCFLLKYDCARDQYRRPFNVDGIKLVDDWQSLAQSAVGVARLTAKDQTEFAYIGSNAKRGELVWRVWHPGARVVRVQLLISGMSTPDEMGDENAKIGVDLVCGEHSSHRRPDAIPFNAQRVDLMEMEKVEAADFTEVHVNFERNEPGGHPSQLFHALFGESATADDFVIRIDFEQPMAQAIDDAQQMELAEKLKLAVVQLKQTPKDVNAWAVIRQIVLILGQVSVQMRKKLLVLLKQVFGIDLEMELKSAIPPTDSADDLMQNLLSPAQQLGQEQFSAAQQQQEQAEVIPPPQKEMTPPKQQTPASPTKVETIAAAGTPATMVVDLDKAAEQINRAIVRSTATSGLMKMFKKKEKSDTEQILRILLSINYNSRQLLAELFKKRFEHENLVELIRKEVQEEPAKELILVLLDNPAMLDAINLHKAMAGLGTTESVLIEILVTRQNSQIQAIKQAYNQLYGKHLEAMLASDTSGAFRTLLQSLCAANRDESMVVKQPKAEQDARSLYAGSEQKLGTDTDTFIALFARENVFQLRAVDAEYNRLAGHHLDEIVRKVFGGDVRDGLSAIVRFVRNPSRLFAEWINEAIKANKELDAIRLLSAHPTANYNLASIGAEFHTLYGNSLAQAVSDAKFETKTALATIVNRGGVL